MITLTAKIYISDTEIIEIDRRNMISIESSTVDRSDFKLPSFGIISNTGRIEFNDNDGRVLRYAEALRLVKGLRCEITLSNTLVEGANELVGVYETDEWDYDNDSRVVSVSLKDDLEEWQDISCEEYPLQNEMTMYAIYEYLLSLTPNKFKNSSGGFNLSVDTKSYLRSVKCLYPYLDSGNLWGQWQKLCEACGLHIYKNSINEVVLSAEFGG